jgi:ribosome-binding factor A
VSGDLQHAKIYISVMGTETEQRLTLRGLRHAAGFIQSKLAKRLQTRFTPLVQFVVDKGVKNSIEMTRLINEALGKPTPAVTDAAEGSRQLEEAAEGPAEEAPEKS